MKPLTKSLILLIVVVLILGAYAFVTGTYQQYTAINPQMSAWRDATHKIALTYPSDRAASSPSPSGALLVGEPRGRIDLAPATFSGTNLIEAAVIIGASRQPIATSNCTKPQPWEMRAESQTLGGETFSVFTGIGAAAGNRYESTSYRLLKQGTCYEIQTLIHSGVFENYPKGTVREFDMTTTKNELTSIVKTVIFE